MQKIFIPVISMLITIFLVTSCFPTAQRELSGHCSDIYSTPNLLNDTGTFKWGNEKNNYVLSDLATTDLPSIWRKQDADFGRDRQDINICKIGTGFLGFDYSKLSSSGALLSDKDYTWECVKDNHTELIWENKSFDEVTTGFNGTPRDGFTYDQTQEVVKRYNTNNKCGKNNWRIPTFKEILSLRALSRSPVINFDSFPGFILYSELINPYRYNDVTYNKKQECLSALQNAGYNSTTNEAELKALEKEIYARATKLNDTRFYDCFHSVDKHLWTSDTCLTNQENSHKQWFMAVNKGEFKCLDKTGKAFDVTSNISKWRRNYILVTD